MIEVRNLTKKYGKTVAVDDLSFTVESGQVYGLLGPNGAGKSTTMNIITGCLAATEGQVLINGHDIFEEPEKAKKCIGFLPEIPPLYMDMTAYEYLSFTGSAKGLKGKELKSQIEEVLKITSTSDVSKRLIGNLSKGYRQRVGIAQALMGEPEIIILDEPTVGLDPMQIIEIRELIRLLGEKHTVILSSHILSEVSEVCDEILIIADGKLVACDSTENLLRLFEQDRIIEIQAKGSVSAVVETLSAVEGIKKVSVKAANSSGVITARITAETDTDPREAIFYAMKNINCPLISLKELHASLEEVFLKLVSGDISPELAESLRNNINKKEDAEE